MAQNDAGPAVLTPAGVAKLLETGDCPVGYKCLAMDCIDCLEIYMDRGGGGNAPTD